MINKRSIIILGSGVGIIIFSLVALFVNTNCSNWSRDIEDKRAILDARQESLGGILDLSGEVEAMRLQFNQEVADYNARCV